MQMSKQGRLFVLLFEAGAWGAMGAVGAFGWCQARRWLRARRRPATGGSAAPTAELSGASRPPPPPPLLQGRVCARLRSLAAITLGSCWLGSRRRRVVLAGSERCQGEGRARMGGPPARSACRLVNLSAGLTASSPWPLSLLSLLWPLWPPPSRPALMIIPSAFLTNRINHLGDYLANANN